MQLNQYATMRNGWTEEAFQRFWKRMGDTFGKSWYEQNGPEPNTTWQTSLVGMSLNQVAFALEHFRKSGDAFPPNLSQFMATAKQFKDQPTYVALPSPKPSAEAVNDSMAAMRDAIKVGGRRKVLLPTESVVDYMEALSAARTNGQSKDDFDRERLRRNGWTSEDETAFRRHAHSLGIRVC